MKSEMMKSFSACQLMTEYLVNKNCIIDEKNIAYHMSMALE